MKFDCIRVVFTALISVGLMLTSGCRNSAEIEDKLDIAETLMEERPDSSLSILEGIDMSRLRGDRIKARYALLKSMALDKNYIDTTTFDVLQPASDYYLKHGNANEKLRTYYYQGVIYKNAGKDDFAMQACLNGLDVDGLVTDTLTYARLLVGQAALYYTQYRIKEFSENNLRAGHLFGKLGVKNLQMRCYGRALDGEIILLNKQRADSIASVCKAEIVKDSTLTIYTKRPMLTYLLNFGDNEGLREMIKEVKEAGISNNMKIPMARAYSKIGDPVAGLQYLNEVNISPDNILDSLTYWSVKTEILENMEEYQACVGAFKNYLRLQSTYDEGLFSNELLFSEQKHAMEIDNMAQIQKRESVINWILTGVALLLLLTLFVYYRYRMNRAGRLIAEGNAEKLRLNNERLHLEGERQRLLAEKLESERAQLKLEAENLHLQIGQLEGEREQLKELLDKQDTLSEEARQLIRERIHLLNGLFAQAITNEDRYGKEFRKYVERIGKDKKKFQQSIGKVLEATHPEFMRHLRECGLTDRETDYVCLYAIGLRGKEIGNYLDLARHYNISSDVRRKLGLDSRGENLGPAIRNLMDGEKAGARREGCAAAKSWASNLNAS